MNKIIILEENINLLKFIFSITENYYDSFYYGLINKNIFNKIDPDVNLILYWFNKLFKHTNYHKNIYHNFYYFFINKIPEYKKYLLNLAKINNGFLRCIPSDLINKKIIKFIVYSNYCNSLYSISDEYINYELVYAIFKNFKKGIPSLFFIEYMNKCIKPIKPNIDINHVLIAPDYDNINIIDLFYITNSNNNLYKNIKELDYLFDKTNYIARHKSNYKMDSFRSQYLYFLKKDYGEINIIMKLFNFLPISYLEKIKINNELLINDLSNYNYNKYIFLYIDKFNVLDDKNFLADQKFLKIFDLFKNPRDVMIHVIKRNYYFHILIFNINNIINNKYIKKELSKDKSLIKNNGKINLLNYINKICIIENNNQQYINNINVYFLNNSTHLLESSSFLKKNISYSYNKKTLFKIFYYKKNYNINQNYFDNRFSSKIYFLEIKPNDKIIQKYLDLIKSGENENTLEFLYFLFYAFWMVKNKEEFMKLINLKYDILEILSLSPKNDKDVINESFKNKFM